MTVRKFVSEGLLQPAIQPKVGLDKLFNLMLRAQKHNLMYIILDECENEFHHRKLQALTIREQSKLYYQARDEIAAYWHRNGWTDIETPEETMQ